jgi:hypothetical protein
MGAVLLDEQNKGGPKMHRAKFNTERVLDKENEQIIKWLRPEAASIYFSMGRNTIDRLAQACGAKKKVANRTVLYDVEKLNEYLNSI